MAETQTSISELIVDARGAEVGSAAYVRAMEAAQRAVDRTIDRQAALEQAIARQTTTMVGGATSISRTAAQWDRLRASLDPVAAAEIRAQRAVEQATIAADNAVKRGLATEVQAAEVLRRLRAQQVVELDKVREAQQRVTLAQEETARTVRTPANDNATFGTLNPSANIAAQFQDIFVTSQMGMSPLQIALQQGTQISAVFGNMGAAGAVRALGAAFASIVSPVSLLTIGLVAAAAAAIQFIGGLLNEAPKGEDALEAHLKWLEKINFGYEQAQKAAQAAIDESQKLPQEAAISEEEARREENLKAVAARYREIIELRSRFETYAGYANAFGVPEDVTASLKLTSDLLQQVTADGELSASETDNLVNVFTKLKTSSPDRNVREIAAAALDMVNNFRAAQGAVDATTASLNQLTSVSLPDWMRGTARGLGAGSGVEALAALTPDNRTAREKGADIFAASVGEARTTSEIDALTAAYGKLNDELDRQEAIRKAAQTARKDSPAENFAEQLAQAEAQARALELQNEMFDATTYETTRAATAFDLLTAAQKAGLEITPDVQANIDAIAERMANARAEAEGLQLALQNRTPYEQLGDELIRLDELFSRGAITADVYARAIGTATANAATSTLGALADLSAGLSQAFEQNKVLSVATAVLKGAEAVASAYAAGNAVFGPVGGVAFAAIAGIAAAKNVADVMSVTKTSKSLPAGGSGSAPVTPAAPAAAPQSRTVTVVMPTSQSRWSRSDIEELVASLNEAAGDGVVLHTVAA